MKRRTFIKSIAGLFAATQIPNVLAKPVATSDPLDKAYEDAVLYGRSFITSDEILRSQKARNIIRRQMIDNLKLSSSIDCFYSPIPGKLRVK